MKTYLFGMTFSFIKVSLEALICAPFPGSDGGDVKLRKRLDAMENGCRYGRRLAHRLGAVHLLHSINNDQQKLHRR